MLFYICEEEILIMKALKIFLLLFVIIFSLTACKNSSDENMQLKYRTIHKQSNTNKDSDLNDNSDSQKKITSLNNYFMDFAGINSTYETPINGNLGINFKEHESLSLVYPDPENDVVYFVNYGKDNYIYELKDGSATLLVDKKANFLQLWDNDLFFLCDESSNGTSNKIDYFLNYFSHRKYISITWTPRNLSWWQMWMPSGCM